MVRFIRIWHSHARRFGLWFRLRNGSNSATTRCDRQGERFVMCQGFSSAPENLPADGPVNLSIREHPWGQNDIRAPVGLIHDGVCDVRGLHGSWNLFGSKCWRLDYVLGRPRERGGSAPALSDLLSRHAERDKLAGVLGAAAPLGRG
jgi:hypothetical protein